MTDKKDNKEIKTLAVNNKKSFVSGSPKRFGKDERQRPKNKKNRPSRRAAKVRSEFDQKIISIRRVTRVVAGGRRFSFSVALISGNRKGSVGVGIGKASDTSLAIEKATRDAKKSMIKVPLDKNMMIIHDVDAKYNASIVSIFPSPEKGLVAGSSVRNVLELAGIKNVTAKMLSRSKNKLNNARAAIKALKQFN
ncbi:30S ribosomal protein S5 [Candidatus Campbellbacteria bacterium CG10_big_fil_rev_8_21_14_0_10_35_52]|uniref:Small ribosomal subunit protein uS5 n=1 Tax=Candidatus Campbellbacteria bacterium CG10_big_fil_rev_8_21_14_0_10_35_52 TaxID=1974527 RepID=A0A2M6WVK1_9BACT|nr:MAG: 30S ribosomal protein S5 [Candidatus Campbellbacteria bacterium CG10_big_fil_rev_8_21_14_0_10_35_52]